MRRIETFLIALICLAGPAAAQQPLSAIDWLEKQASIPVAQPRIIVPDEPPVTDSATTPGVKVTPLGESRPDSVGLLPSASTGLPRGLWQASRTEALSRLFAHADPESLPAVRALLYTLLLAEADAPLETAAGGGAFLKARLHALTRFGAVDPARALLERAGPETPALFDTWLNLSLLSGNEDQACATLRKTPTLSNDYAARVFCTARAGDWDTAALTYEAASALGALTPPEGTLLAQFLDPDLIETAQPAVPPKAPTPLVFRLYEAVGTPLPTRALPRAFAVADLRGLSGWKAEIEAAERLARTGALPTGRLLGLYTERKPAASGGVWDRVTAMQTLDKALFRRAPEDVANALPDAWNAARTQGIEVPFAQMFWTPLSNIVLPDRVQDLAFRIALLSPDYEAAAQEFEAGGRADRLLSGLARGAPERDLAQTRLERAVVAGFTAQGAAPAHRALIDAGKLGEAILSAALLMGHGTPGSEADVTAALSTLRAVGLEDTARRAALQLLILGTGQ